ncbi:hypothetical protein SAMN04488581_3157 [Mycolicibacterium neoaurum]|uniref:HTH marR-type domain-containing protein n=2 Tax=Mycobacteriaceae TaxID=1762 RepID=A0AAV2WKQ8_MYCNE|nr:hypothetical protein BN1047_02306 [Mycolicibacterium neoaurum]SDD97130.1 hypothetical protein SAMN04488581_3157 [Mycolicibacterium neoaurum]
MTDTKHADYRSALRESHMLSGMPVSRKSTEKAAAPRKASARATAQPAVAPPRTWTFLTNHAHVLLCLAQGESLTARELSVLIGITERSVQAILADLIADGYLKKSKVGRRNRYTVNRAGRLRHPLESAHSVGQLIDALS